MSHLVKQLEVWRSVRCVEFSPPANYFSDDSPTLEHSPITTEDQLWRGQVQLALRKAPMLTELGRQYHGVADGFDLLPKFMRLQRLWVRSG